MTDIYQLFTNSIDKILPLKRSNAIRRKRRGRNNVASSVPMTRFSLLGFLSEVKEVTSKLEVVCNRTESIHSLHPQIEFVKANFAVPTSPEIETVSKTNLQKFFSGELLEQKWPLISIETSLQTNVKEKTNVTNNVYFVTPLLRSKKASLEKIKAPPRNSSLTFKQ